MDKFDTSETNKSVCPNDRQLALRAKLQTGWSSCRLTSGSIGPEEQSTILSVIKRAELVDKSEQERVGRLVERLENMKRRAMDRGPRQCRLCGCPFGILGPSRHICDDCERSVCAQCSVELPGSPKAREHWICRICSETREIWKKSGAWFFKGLPKYTLPGLSQSQQKQRNMSRPNDRTVDVIDNSSSDEDHDIYSPTKSETNGGAGNYTRQISSNSTKQPQSQGNSSNADGSESLGRNDSLKARIRSLQRKPSVGSNWSEDSLLREATLGWLELSVTFDRIGCAVHCSIVRARDLPAMDASGLTDPFCKLTILPAGGRPAHWLRTKTVHKTRNPEFNESVTFYGIAECDLLERALHVVLMDDDKYGNDILGSVQINLNNLHISGKSNRLSVPLISENGSDLPGVHDKWPRGKILLTLCYNTKKRALVVLINKCKDLAAMDSNGFSDPFVKMQLKPDRHHRKHKTSIKWRTLNPIFNEEFSFETRPTELARQSLIITVWDKDYGKSNDFLGGLELGPTSKGRRLKQWRDCVKFPDHRHEQWHCLAPHPPS